MRHYTLTNVATISNILSFVFWNCILNLSHTGELHRIEFSLSTVFPKFIADFIHKLCLPWR